MRSVGLGVCSDYLEIPVSVRGKRRLEEDLGAEKQAEMTDLRWWTIYRVRRVASLFERDEPALRIEIHSRVICRHRRYPIPPSHLLRDP